jgi:DivIVA domain-containing protein
VKLGTSPGNPERKVGPAVPFSPEEIENKEFLITLRGYDKDEVQAFLRAVAADYRSVAESSRSSTAPVTASNPFESLGEEVGTVLKVARESANQLRQKAEDAAAAARRRAEEESAALRNAASAAAKRLTEEAERHAIEVRAAAEREAGDRLRETARRVERLQATETKLRQRLYSLEMMLQSMRQELDAADTAGVELAATPPEGSAGDVEDLPGEELSVETPASAAGDFGGDDRVGEPLEGQSENTFG